MAPPVYAALLLLVSTTAFARECVFHVTADGRSIGTHRFEVTGNAQHRQVQTTAIFVARARLIPIYHYEHHDKESWLQQHLLNSQTGEFTRR
jgi:hypothetical protein